MNHKRLIFINCLMLSTPVLAVDATASLPIAATHKTQSSAGLPYTLSETQLSFSKTTHGGVQQVHTKLDSNNKQIQLIQSYLLNTSNALRIGDFSDSEAIHGANMPGLALLKTAKPNQIKFEYKALANGAQIHYASDYPKFVKALHEWFDAQASYHANAVIEDHKQHPTNIRK